MTRHLTRAPRPTWAVLIALLLLVGSVAINAQRGFGRFIREGPGNPIMWPPPDFEDGKFAFCKVMYTSVRSEPMGVGWWTDYPFAGIHLMIRFSELTKGRVSRDPAGDVQHWVVRLTDDALFSCPFVMASDVGTIGLSPEEVVRLREYLLKGGFFWVDDFWGNAAWAQWSSEIAKVLPPDEYPILDLPLDHPVFQAMFEVTKVPQVTNIMNWRRTGSTSERGAETATAHFRAILDKRDRIMVAMTFNTDIGDSWEREGEDQDFFMRFSPPGYALGINVLLYALTH
jgi:hypothetical protein